MQLRRILLLFALVLGLSALVAALAPPPEEDEEPSERGSTVAAPRLQTDLSAPIRLPARAGSTRLRVRRVEAGSSFSLEVPVPEAGDVVIDDLGLRQTADPLSPARFDLLAAPLGRHAVGFVPVRGRRRLSGRLAFVAPRTVTRPRRDR